MSNDDPELPGGDEPPMDLGALRLDPIRLEAIASRIDRAAAPALARRAAAEELQRTLARAVWPALLAAAAALVGAVGLHRSSSTSADSGLATAGIERILPASASSAGWILEQSAPSDADLAQAIGLGVAR